MSEKHPIYYRDPEHARMFESSYLHLDEAHKRAKMILTENEIKLERFAGLYDENVLAHDIEKVERLKKRFEPSPSKAYADIFEAIVCEHGELSEWFGSGCEIIKTSLFDDYVNGVDMIAEIKGEHQGFSHLALGIDVTFGSKDLREKFIPIRTGIDKGSLGEIKYFYSDRQHYRAHLEKVPQVVVGVEIEQLKNLALLWMNRKNKELSRHPAQMTILEEIALQLETFERYANKSEKREVQNLAPILGRELWKIRSLLEEKRKMGILGMKDDKVFEEIRKNLHSFTPI